MNLEHLFEIIYPERNTMLFEEIYFECNIKPLVEQILKETNGQSIPTKAMADYKRENIPIDKIYDEIENKLKQHAITLQTYLTKDNDAFKNDYNNVYSNRLFNTPIGVKMGDNQADKFIEKRTTGASLCYKRNN